MKSKLTKDAVLGMLQQYGIPLIQENDLTLKDVRDKYGWEKSSAMTALKHMVMAGKLETMIVLGQGHVRTRIWRPITK